MNARGAAHDRDGDSRTPPEGVGPAREEATQGLSHPTDPVALPETRVWLRSAWATRSRRSWLSSALRICAPLRAQQSGRVSGIAVPAEGLDTDAHGQAAELCLLAEISAELVGEHRAQAARDEIGLSRTRTAQQRAELVPAQAADDVAAAQAVRQRAADAREDIVACCVPERVVDLLEPVEVDDEQRPRVRIDLATTNLISELELEVPTVDHARERVVPLPSANPRGAEAAANVARILDDV